MCMTCLPLISVMQGHVTCISKICGTLATTQYDLPIHAMGPSVGDFSAYYFTLISVLYAKAIVQGHHLGNINIIPFIYGRCPARGAFLGSTTSLSVQNNRVV